MEYENLFHLGEQPSQAFFSCQTYNMNAGSYFPRHCHSYYEIDFILEGERYETLNETNFAVKRNTLIFIPPLTIHGLRNTTDIEYVLIQFANMFVSNSSTLFDSNFMLRTLDMPNAFIDIAIGSRIYEILCGLRDCCKKRNRIAKEENGALNVKLSCSFMLHSLCLEILSILLEEGKIYVDSNGAAYSDIASIGSLIGELMTNPSNAISMQDACRLVGMSYSHFSRFFKRVTGFDYSYFCNLLRIRHAEELLLNTDKPISEVAETIGVDTLSYFTRLFKQINGNTPSDYRRLYKHKNLI